MSIIKKFQSGLTKTSNYLTSNILDILSFKKIDAEVVDELENILLSSDIGLEVTNLLINKIKSSKISNLKDSKEIFQILANELEIILKPREKLLLPKKSESVTFRKHQNVLFKVLLKFYSKTAYSAPPRNTDE